MKEKCKKCGTELVYVKEPDPVDPDAIIVFCPKCEARDIVPPTLGVSVGESVKTDARFGK